MLRAWSARSSSLLRFRAAASHGVGNASASSQLQQQQQERQSPAFLQKRHGSRNPENVQNRHVPYGATLRGESEHMRKLTSEGWKAERDQIVVDHDPFMAERFHKQIHEQLRDAKEYAATYDQGEDTLENVRNRVDKLLDDLGVPTVAEDFNARQALHGNHARGTPHDAIRTTLNRSERLAGLPSYNTRTGPLTEAELRLLQRSRTIPEIAFLMKYADKSSIRELNEQYQSALKSVQKTMDDPASIAQATQPRATFSRFDMSSLMAAREANEALIDAVRLDVELRPEAADEGDLLASTQNQNDALESGDPAPATAAVLTEDAGENDIIGDLFLDPTETPSKSTADSAASTSEKSANGLEALRAHLSRRYHIVTEDSYSLKNIGAEHPNRHQVYARDDWEKRDPHHVTLDAYTSSSRHYFDALPSRSVCRDGPQADGARRVQQIQTEFDLAEAQPYQASLGARALNVGRSGDYSVPDSYTTDQARIIQGRLFEVEANKVDKETPPATMHSQLDFLDHLDYEKDIAAALEDKEVEVAAAEDQALDSSSQDEDDTSDFSDAEDDNVGELQRILQDENYEKKQEDDIELLVEQRRQQFKLPDYDNFDVNSIVAEGGSVRHVENSLYEFLLGEKPGKVLEDDIFYNHIPEDVLPAKEFLKKMRDAFGDSPPVHVYDEGIVGYVRSEHLREAMHLFADMKKQGLTPSEESYASVVEGFYMNFDILGGDHLSQEMKQVYPSSTPPTLEVVTGLQDPTHSLDA